MRTDLFHDPIYGTRIVFNGTDEVRVVTTAGTAFGQHTMQLDLDDVDRLLAVNEHAVNPVEDIAEFFRNVHHASERGARRGAEAFVASAGSLAEIVYG